MRRAQFAIHSETARSQRAVHTGELVSEDEKGTVRPSVITLYRLAKVLDCSPTLLLEDFVSPNEED